MRALSNTEISKLLYHATFRVNLASIKKLGLGAKQVKNWDISKTGVVYFSADPFTAQSYCEAAENVSDYKYDSGIVVLAVRKPDAANIRFDGNIQGTDNCYTYGGVLNPNNIYVVCSRHGELQLVGKLTELKRVPSFE